MVGRLTSIAASALPQQFVYTCYACARPAQTLAEFYEVVIENVAPVSERKMGERERQHRKIPLPLLLLLHAKPHAPRMFAIYRDDLVDAAEPG